MKHWLAIALCCLAPVCVPAQSAEEMSFDELFDLGQQFVEENMDEEVLRQLGEPDEKKVQALLKQLQREFEQEYVLDLAGLKEVANAGITLLASTPETEPYAEWLRPRLDYFDAAYQLDQLVPAPSSTPSQSQPRKPPPTVRQEKIVWAQTVKARPRPAAAAEFEKPLKAIFERNGVPKELFWMAEIESSFRPKAKSPAGAVGMYQLMPATAQSLGLSTWPFDERKDVEKSADAASRHLRALYKQFNDWPLAVAAYNAGAGRVSSKITGKQAKSFEAIASKLPSETQLYVPKLDAILQLREGKSLNDLAKGP